MYMFAIDHDNENTKSTQAIAPLLHSCLAIFAHKFPAHFRLHISFQVSVGQMRHDNDLWAPLPREIRIDRQ